MFITFEGLDFCGKSTQVKLLEDYLLNRNNKVEILREPGGTPISEKIRDILLDNKNSELTEYTEMLLFAASRSQLVDQLVIPKLKEGYFIISDRFHDSSIAYQGYGREINIDFVSQLQNFVIKNTLPDLTFFIDITIEELNRRKLLLKDLKPDRIESSKDKFYEKVRNGYKQLAVKEKRFIEINGLLSVDKIHSIIIDTIKIYESSRTGNNNVKV
jgi:dTMP kinase